MGRLMPLALLAFLATADPKAAEIVRAASPGNEDLIPATALDEAKLTKYWQCPIPLDPDEQITALYLEDEMLYAATSLGALFAIDADVGLVRWSALVAEPPFEVFRPCHPRADTRAARMRTVVASPMTIKVFHRLTGKLIAEMQPEITPSGPPVADEDTIYIGSVTERFVALRIVDEGIYAPTPKKKGLMYYAIIVLPDGERLYEEAESLAKARQWQREWVDRLGGLQTERKSAIRRWQFGSEGAVRSRPAVFERTAVVASDGGAVFAVGLYKRDLDWKETVPGGILAAPLLGDGKVYVATTERSIYAFDATRGTKRWQCLVPTPMRRNGALTKRMLYYPAEPQGLFAIDPKSGKHLWTFDRGHGFLAEYGDAVFVFEPGKAIHQVDVDSGELMRSIACPEATESVANSRDETLYVCSARGRLMCIRPENVPYLRRAQFDMAMRGVPAVEEDAEQAETPPTKKVRKMTRKAGVKKATKPRPRPKRSPGAQGAAKSPRTKAPAKKTRRQPAAKSKTGDPKKRISRDSADKPPGY